MRTECSVSKDSVETPETKKSKLFDTPLSDIVLHRNYNCCENTPGVPHSACLVRVGACRVQFHEHQESFQGEATGCSQCIELLKFSEAVGGCDTEMDFEETRGMSDSVAPLLLANIANGRSMKDMPLGVCGLGTRWPLPVGS